MMTSAMMEVPNLSSNSFNEQKYTNTMPSKEQHNKISFYASSDCDEDEPSCMESATENTDDEFILIEATFLLILSFSRI